MADKSFVAGDVGFTNVVIASGGATSAAADLKSRKLVGIILPAAFDGTTLTFSAASAADGTYYPVYDGSNTAISLTVAHTRYIGLTDAQASQLSGLRYLKVTSGTNQSTTDTTVTLVSISR